MTAANIWYILRVKRDGVMFKVLNLFVDSKHNEDVLVSDLSLRRQGKSIMYSNDNAVFLSPYISEGKYNFDISGANIEKYIISNKKGYLLIRFHDKYLLEEMDRFLDELIDESSKSPYYRNSAEYRWKFKIVIDGCHYIQRIKNKKLMAIKEYTRESLIDMIRKLDDARVRIQ